MKRLNQRSVKMRFASGDSIGVDGKTDTSLKSLVLSSLRVKFNRRIGRPSIAYKYRLQAAILSIALGVYMIICCVNLCPRNGKLRIC